MLALNNGQRLAVEAAISLGELATACGVARSTAQLWKRGENVPGEVHRVAIFEAFGIEPSAWDIGLPAGFEITVPPPKRVGRPKNTAKKKPTKRAPKKTTAPATPAPKPAVHPYPPAPDADAPVVESCPACAEKISDALRAHE